MAIESHRDIQRSGVSAFAGGGAALGFWDEWYEQYMTISAGGGGDRLQGLAVNSGTNTSSYPAANSLGYNPFGVLLRSSATAASGFRYYTTVNNNLYFGQGVARKFRCQYMPLTAFDQRLLRLGWHGWIGAFAVTDGAFFELDDAVVSAWTMDNGGSAHATTYTMTLGVPYTFDIDVSADGLTKRFRIYANNDPTAVFDVTMSDSRLTSGTRRTGVAVVAIHEGSAAVDIGVLHRVGFGTLAMFERLYGVSA